MKDIPLVELSGTNSQDNSLKTDTPPEGEGKWTKIGVTPDSFKKSRFGGDLNHTLKARHLHMIAIGESSCRFRLLLCADSPSKAAPSEQVFSSAAEAHSTVGAPALFLSACECCRNMNECTG